MMRVLEKGKPWSVQIACSGEGNGGAGCGARLEAEIADMRYYAGSEYPIYRSNAVTVRCPDCGTITDLPKQSWPPRPHDLEPFTRKWADGKDSAQ